MNSRYVIALALCVALSGCFFPHNRWGAFPLTTHLTSKEISEFRNMIGLFPSRSVFVIRFFSHETFCYAATLEEEERALVRSLLDETGHCLNYDVYLQGEDSHLYKLPDQNIITPARLYYLKGGAMKLQFCIYHPAIGLERWDLTGQWKDYGEDAGFPLRVVVVSKVVATRSDGSTYDVVKDQKVIRRVAESSIWEDLKAGRIKESDLLKKPDPEMLKRVERWNNNLPQNK